MIQYENKRKDKIMRLKKILEKKEMEKLQPIPKISKHSIQLLKNTKSNKADLIKRMKEEEEKTLRKRLELETGKQCIPVWHKPRGKEEFLKKNLQIKNLINFILIWLKKIK